MRPKLSFSVFAVLAALCAPAQAGDIVDAAAKAEAAIAAGDFDAWYAANEVLLAAAWTAGGLHFGSLFAVTAAVTSFGEFVPRDDTVYAANEAIHLYVEPRGYGYGDLGAGQFEIAFDIDLRVLDPAGAVMLEQPNFGAFTVKSTARARELFVNLTATLDGAPAGDYTLEFIFRDKHSDQTASFTNDVTIQ